MLLPHTCIHIHLFLPGSALDRVSWHDLEIMDSRRYTTGVLINIVVVLFYAGHDARRATAVCATPMYLRPAGVAGWIRE